MALYPPNIIYPNGRENIYLRQINIEWENLVELDASSPIMYEILFTDSYIDEDIDNIEWVQIAIVSCTATSFLWNIPFYVKSNLCRVAIRSRNFRGERSNLSISADNFVIQSKILQPPAIFSPTEKTTYYSYIPIILNNEALLGTHSSRSFYRIYYSSESQGTEWSLVVDNLHIDSSVYYWDVRSFNGADDYSLKVELVEGDNISLPSFIRNISISSLNYFIIDTEPPMGTIKIVDNIEFTNQRDIVLEMTAFDETTNVKSISIQQANDNPENIVATSIPQENSNRVSWQITGDDGIKYMQAKLEDYGGNITVLKHMKQKFTNIVENENKRYFRTYDSIVNKKATSFTSYNNDLWNSFDNQLYKNKELVYTDINNITALRFFNNILYIGSKNSENKGILERRNNNVISIINSFSSYNSIINVMDVFNSNLFIGCENGELYVFNGISLSLINSFSSSIINLFTDNSTLYIFLKGESKIVSYNCVDFSNIIID